MFMLVHDMDSCEWHSFLLFTVAYSALASFCFATQHPKMCLVAPPGFFVLEDFTGCVDRLCFACCDGFANAPHTPGVASRAVQPHDNKLYEGAKPGGVGSHLVPGEPASKRGGAGGDDIPLSHDGYRYLAGCQRVPGAAHAVPPRDGAVRLLHVL